MSIILKGIDLPTDRKPYGIEVIYRFEGSDGLFSEKNYLSPNQAVQIPKGHGRLIDGDLLKDTVRDSVPAYTIGVKIPTFGDTQIMSAIDVMPTILDKERE